MRRMCYKLIVSMLVLSAYAPASELIHFRDTTTSWSEVKSIAEKEHKLVFIDAYTDWCIWCKVMDRETFADSTVAKFMEEKFVPVRYEMETGFGLKMSEKYRVNGYPTFLIFTPDGKLVYRILGYVKSKEFLEKLASALDPAQQDHLTGISNELDPGFPEFYKRSFGKKEVRVRPDSATVVGYLATQSDLFGEVPWSVMFHFSYLLTDKYKDFIYANYDKLKGMYGSNDVESAVSTFLASDLTSAIKANDETALAKVIASSEKYMSQPANEIEFNDKLRFDVGTNRWTSYADLIDSAKQSSAKMDPNAVNDYSWTVYTSCPDKAVVARATKWMSEAISESPMYMLLDTYAALLFKNGELENAKKYAEIAIDEGKKEKEDYKSTEELLKKINASLEKKL
ncbi:MAG TPA: thioredoxin fold domain-containing protein [Bacteroidota bacterium]|nr:thioredoxin fold domain-containing protein [Bacteroidota bacterium]